MKKLAVMTVLAGATAGWMGTSLTAKAGSVDLTYTGGQYTSGYQNAYITTSDAIGLYSFHVNSSTLPGVSAGSTIYSICLSPAGLLDSSAHVYTPETFDQASPGINPSLWANPNSAPNAGIDNAAFIFSKFASPTMGADAATALEFAIWTALYNSTGYGTFSSTGSSTWQQPTISGGILTDYNNYLAALTPSANPLTPYTEYILEGQPNPVSDPNDPNATPAPGQAQELFFLVPDGGSTVALLGAAISGMALLRRKLTA